MTENLLSLNRDLSVLRLLNNSFKRKNLDIGMASKSEKGFPLQKWIIVYIVSCESDGQCQIFLQASHFILKQPFLQWPHRPESEAVIVYSFQFIYMAYRTKVIVGHYTGKSIPFDILTKKGSSFLTLWAKIPFFFVWKGKYKYNSLKPHPGHWPYKNIFFFHQTRNSWEAAGI